MLSCFLLIYGSQLPWYCIVCICGTLGGSDPLKPKTPVVMSMTTPGRPGCSRTSTARSAWPAPACARWSRAADGRGPLFWATEYKQEEMIALLKEAGADENAKDADKIF